MALEKLRDISVDLTLSKTKTIAVPAHTSATYVNANTICMHLQLKENLKQIL